MAKTKMICPFSKELCVECSQYRGRHYYLCFCSKYRGCLMDHEGMKGKISTEREMDKRYGMPPVITRGSTWLILDHFLERNER
jgi:hypothetical protein